MEHQFGLQKLKKDRRDFSHSKTFGAADLSQLPLEYILPSTILNQNGFPQCTAYSACATRESQAGIQFDTNDFFLAEGVINGAVQELGYDLRVEMATGCKYGWKPNSGGDPSAYKEDSYFDVSSGSYDLFDNIRSAMWQGKDEKRCAVIGTMWYNDWDSTKEGVVSNVYSSPKGLHAIKCAGWTKKNGIDYLVIQNSWGDGAGDKGFFYFPREVVNREFTEGAFMWRLKPDPQDIKRVSSILNLISQVLNLLAKLAGLKVNYA